MSNFWRAFALSFDAKSLKFHLCFPQIPEELTLDYAEITSIPPLPLWTLLAADKETAGLKAQQSEEVKVGRN